MPLCIQKSKLGYNKVLSIRSGSKASQNQYFAGHNRFLNDRVYSSSQYKQLVSRMDSILYFFLIINSQTFYQALYLVQKKKKQLGGNYRVITLICSGIVYIKYQTSYKQNSVTTQKKTILTYLFTKGYYFTQIQ